MDLLGWKKGVSNEQGNVFVSTLGNINTYTAFVALTMAVACGCFVSERKVGRRIWYYLVSALAFFALITGQSDNAYLSLGMLFAVMPLFLFTTWRGIADYGILAATFMTVIKVVDTVNKVYASLCLETEDGTDESREQTGTMDLAWLVCRFDSWMPGSGICPL